VSSPELGIALWIMLGELMDSSRLNNGGCWVSSRQLNIGKWRVSGELMDS
jgi:hypothetical protein